MKFKHQRMTLLNPEKIALPIPGIETLQAEARAEGYQFMDTLMVEWLNGENRFDRTGEALYGHLSDGRLVALGGLAIDQFLRDPRVGRIRRVYVRPQWRNQGIGRSLVTSLVEEARKTFNSVRLRAKSPDAARLYERIGFTPIENPDATHILFFG